MKAGRADPVGLPVVSRLRWLPLPAARTALRLLGLGDLGIRHGVALRRVLYVTAGPDGRPTVASALVATPVGAEPHAVVCYQHATQSHRVNVPSTPHRLEGVLTSVVFAGAGYALAAPDYQGLGSGTGHHPYLHAATEASSVTDLLAVLPQVLERTGTAVPRRTALLGFSQGGHASLAALESLSATAEDLDLDLVGVASVAGVHRLLESAGPHTLSGASAHHSTYLAYLATSYARLHRQPLSSIVRPRWARRLPLLMDGAHGMAQIEQALPRDPTQVLTRETVEDLIGPGEGWFAQRLAANSVGDVAAVAPVRFFVGSRDVDAPPVDAARTARLIRARGGSAEVVDVGPVDHRGTAFAAVGLARRWFDDLLDVETPELPGVAATGASVPERWRGRLTRALPVLGRTRPLGA
ncbi:alpha/beta hydrolase [Ornithinimicrobium pekingense]|uniref:Lipase n=1 Tax=Ornithinimicrobium pekingense TaxID=384677 RepID=A0ABQ2F614_9MICO|nr:lipase family protein [Ornithinimicrobium pekingense]GGK55871.1 hypothetical protein GCM10011509_00230 [Ornithinimicrobium pekingense]